MNTLEQHTFEEPKRNSSDGEYSSSQHDTIPRDQNVLRSLATDHSTNSMGLDIDLEVQEFVGGEGTELSRHSTFLQRTQSRFSFFNEKLKAKRFGLLREFLIVYLVMGTLVLGIFSIYWGSLFDRQSRLKNLRMLVVIEDDQVVQGIEPYIGNTFIDLLDTPEMRHIGNWNIYNSSEFAVLAERHNNTIEQEIRRQIHHRQYWSSIYIKGNASFNLYQAILDGNTQYNVSDESINTIYETGRDFLNMNSYVTPIIKQVEQAWLKLLNNVTTSITSNLQDKSQVFSNSDSITVLTTPLQFTYYDYSPFTDAVITAPVQVGLIYMIIVTFFQFNFFIEIHQKVSKFGLKSRHLMLYRVLSSIFSFFLLSLFFAFVSLAMQVDFTKTFGHSGFLVYWMVCFLTMWAVGMANEIAGLLLIVYYPPLIGFWMLFWVIINISATFSPMALTPEFYRYGYAMPLHNSFEITKVILFNTWKGELGRNFGILIAWVVILTACLPPTIIFFQKKMGQKAQAAAKAAAEAKAEEEKSGFKPN